jgi:dTDP-4-dehydrorhamnose reductase
MSPEKNNYFYPPEIWGGLECTINRVGDTYKDQFLSTGHYLRTTDIRQIAGLGIKRLRYPVLWERHQPNKDSAIDWNWTDIQLETIRSNGMEPIIGLLHHGSGPRFTSLESPDFAKDFADYAGQVARRYPWIVKYNPINEPLTTARFSGLYGIWYPHARDPRRFVDMVLNQLKAVILAMEAIRNINPEAKLIQTEDLAKVHSTGLLAYQADFENNRRWLSYDLLCGKLDKYHPLWDYLMYLGIDDRKLAFFSERACPPDMLGVNYYITSERFLDEGFQKYPENARGGNGRDVYADIEAVRTVGISGLYSLLNEVWNRYGLPMAITEAHINCTREEQMRWLKEIWDHSCRAKQAGMDVRAVTAWALSGAHDWDSLLTRNDLHYESGAFAIGENELHLTGVGRLIRALADSGNFSHPLLDQKGWWHGRKPVDNRLHRRSQPLLIVSLAGDHCQRVEAICRQRGIVYKTLIIKEPSLASVRDFQRRIAIIKPWGALIADTGKGQINTLATICGYLEIPIRRVPQEQLSSPVLINDVIDRFIDEAVSGCSEKEAFAVPLKRSVYKTSYAK